LSKQLLADADRSLWLIVASRIEANLNAATSYFLPFFVGKISIDAMKVKYNLPSIKREFNHV